jgi:hypothetical protein
MTGLLAARVVPSEAPGHIAPAMTEAASRNVAIALDGVSKRFAQGGTLALDGVSFSIRAGRCSASSAAPAPASPR